jgi:hypothetical protein
MDRHEPASFQRNVALIHYGSIHVIGIGTSTQFKMFGGGGGGGTVVQGLIILM